MRKKKEVFSHEFLEAAVKVMASYLRYYYGIGNETDARTIVENYPTVAKGIYERIKKEMPKGSKYSNENTRRDK